MDEEARSDCPAMSSLPSMTSIHCQHRACNKKTFVDANSVTVIKALGCDSLSEAIDFEQTTWCEGLRLGSAPGYCCPLHSGEEVGRPVNLLGMTDNTSNTQHRTI